MFLTRSEYDRSVNTFSPEGRLFQVEYAIEAIKLGSTAIGIQTSEGVVLAAEKRITSTLMEQSSIEKIINEYELFHDNFSENGKFGFGKVNLYFRLFAFLWQLLVYNFTRIFFLQNCIVIEAALESNISDTYTQDGNLSLNDLNYQGANKNVEVSKMPQCEKSRNLTDF